MKQNEKQELETQIQVLKYERNELHKSYVGAVKNTATEIYKMLMELADGQGGVVYDCDLKDILKIYGVEIKE